MLKTHCPIDKGWGFEKKKPIASFWYSKYTGKPFLNYDTCLWRAFFPLTNECKSTEQIIRSLSLSLSLLSYLYKITQAPISFMQVLMTFYLTVIRCVVIFFFLLCVSFLPSIFKQKKQLHPFGGCFMHWVQAPYFCSGIFAGNKELKH